MLDYAPGNIVYVKFATVRPSTGAPFALSGGTISVYKDNSTTQSTTGVSLTADFDGVTGLNHVTIDTSADGTFYSAGSSFQVVITAGTVDSVSVVGQPVGEFTLNRASVLRPTTAGRTLDVSAGGEAGIDLANVGSPTTTLNLSGTTISTSQAVASVTGSVGSVTGNVGGSVGSVLGNVGGTVTTVTTLSNLPAIPNNWLTAAGIAAGALNGKGDWNIGKTGYALSASGVQAIWDVLTSALTTVGSIGQLLVYRIDAAISSRSTYAGGDTAGTTTLLSRIVGTLASGTHNPQSGDAFAAIGTESSKITAIKAVTDKLDTAMELDGLVYRFTINALEQAPSGGGGSTDWTADERTALRTIFGIPASGTTPEVPSAGALKVIDDLLDTEIGALTTAVADLPTNAELATALGTSDDATLAAIAGLNNLSAAQVNAEVLDVLNVDTFAELSAPPAATSSLRAKITWLFMWARNRSTQTSTQRRLYADDGTTVVGTEAVSDDGTTYSKGEAS